MSMAKYERLLRRRDAIRWQISGLSKHAKDLQTARSRLRRKTAEKRSFLPADRLPISSSHSSFLKAKSADANFDWRNLVARCGAG
jgi:hypothetical protein